MNTPLLDAMTKALATLSAHAVVPGSLEITRAQYERLKLECGYPEHLDPPKSLLGIKIVVKE